MSPGTSGSNTLRALNERLASLPPGESLVVCVPIVEKYEQQTGGSYDVQVTGFASFELTGYNAKGEVQGEFIEYVANPHAFGGPGTGPGLYAPRLVAPQ